jgi:SulP family sulfate permease
LLRLKNKAIQLKGQKGDLMNTIDYNFKNLKPDLLSGLTTATIALPQNMAYALILGVNPIYGIYASIFSMIVATLLNSSSVLIVGPTNMMAVAMYSSLTNFQGSNYLQVILLTTFLIGLFQFLLVTFNLSELIKYVSHPVVVALTHGAAILILFSQLTNFTGVEVQGSNVIFKSISFIQNIDGINTINLGVGILTLLLLLIINKINKQLPEYLITVILVTFITYVTGIYEQIPLVGEIPQRIIDFNMIQFDLKTIGEIYSIAFSIALLGLIQTMAVL